MAVDRATVQRIAKLARIAIKDELAGRLEDELNTILHWVEQLDEVDTGDVEPMTSVVHMEMKKRDDEITDGDYADTIVGNAPAREDSYFTVPKVVE